MALVAIVAIMYSPSTVRITLGGFSTSPVAIGGSSTSLFLSYIKEQGYKVILLNNSAQLNQIQDGIYLLIGPDTALSIQDANFIKNMYDEGRLSLLIAEGNSTNNIFLESTFDSTVSGAAVIVPSSNFVDKRVYIANFQLGKETLSGVIDISSYLILRSNVLQVVFSTPLNSYDTSDRSNYARPVVAIAQTPNSRALIITDSGPFTNSIINTTIIDEKKFSLSLLEWVTNGDTEKTIYYDNYHYVTKGPQFSFGLPVGPLFVYALSLAISNLNNYYQELPFTIQSITHLSLFDSSLIAGIPVLLFAYALVRKVIQKEKNERDDIEPPEIETNVVSVSKHRIEFDEFVKKKSFYVATAERLYQLLDEASQKFLSMKFEEILYNPKDKSIMDDRDMSKFIRDMIKVHQYAIGKRAFIFPPILRWKSKLQWFNMHAENFLNIIGAKTADVHIRIREGRKNNG